MEEKLTELEFAAQGKRKRLRLCYLAAVKVTLGNDNIVRGNIRDIGMESLFVKIGGDAHKEMVEDDKVDIEIIVNQGLSRLTIATPGQILRVDFDGVAIKFLEPLKWWPLFSLFPVNDHFLFEIVSNNQYLGKNFL